MGTSLPNANPWLMSETKPKQCLIKLYDENTRAFKLNDVVTFIGILEFSTEEEVKQQANLLDAEGNS
jgi:Mini-chromosome maintenance replisome factor